MDFFSRNSPRLRALVPLFAVLAVLGGLWGATTCHEAPPPPGRLALEASTGPLGASGSYAYPVGPAGGVLGCTYPNPCLAGAPSDAGADALADGGEYLISYDPNQGILKYNPFPVTSYGPVCFGDGGFGQCSGASLAATRAYYGAGTDGTVTYDGVATVAGVSPVGGACPASPCTYTLTRPVAFVNVTVNSTITVITAGSIIFAKGTLTVNGTIENDGAAASGITAGAGAAHLLLVGGSNGGNGDGAGGAVPGVTFVNNTGFGGSGGAGANGSGIGGSAGAAGGGLNNSAGIPIQSIPHVDWLAGGTLGVSGATGVAVPEGFGGGAGGGGGGCNGIGTGVCSGGTGGGGGGGAGAQVLSVAILAGSGAIHARGGAGGTAAGGGGGGGGGGGADIIIEGDDSGYSGTIDENGGAPGAGSPSGNAGNAGHHLLIQG